MAPRLLLADDSVTIQRVIELTFADEEVEVTSVGDGREAIERIQADPPDIVLADVGMPERDGYEVAAFLKSQPHLAHIPVVLLTGAFEPLDDERARAAGCDGILVKPFEPQTVIGRVRELLARRRPAESPRREPPRAGLPAALEAAQRSEPGIATAQTPREERDDYFDRLDAALARLATTSAGRHPETVPEPADDTAAPPGAAHPPSLAEAFAALLAAEQGQVPPPAAWPAASAVSEDVIEEIVRRVIARMGDADMRRLVLDSAERLVREEIERIKAR